LYVDPERKKKEAKLGKENKRMIRIYAMTSNCSVRINVNANQDYRRAKHKLLCKKIKMKLWRYYFLLGSVFCRRSWNWKILW